jgi:hypothetical protein
VILDPIGLLIAIIIVGLLVWVAQQFLPEPFRRIAVVVGVVLVVLYLLRALRPGLF